MLRSKPIEGQSLAARRLRSIQRSDEILRRTYESRKQMEGFLSFRYCFDDQMGGGYTNGEAHRRYAYNLPYCYWRWLEAQATGEPLTVKMPRDAGATATAPGDDETGEAVSVMAERVLYEARIESELNSVIAECCGRGSSFLVIGYHQEAVTMNQAREVGKDAQSIMPDVLQLGETDAAPGQVHAEVATNLQAMASDEFVQASVGRDGIASLLDRALSHSEAAYKQEVNRDAVESVRLIRRRVWVRHARGGDKVFWDPTVTDLQDAKWMALRHVWSLAEVKASPMFTAKFKSKVRGVSSRSSSTVLEGSQTPAESDMGSSARQAQAEDLPDDDRAVEWFEVYEKRPEMLAGGVRYALCGEFPDEMVSVDDQYPYVDENGECLIPDFYPIYDFAPLKGTLPIPERTTGIPLIAPGWTSVLRLMEYNRLRTESARKHSLRLYQYHPSLKERHEVLEAIQGGVDGYGFCAEASSFDNNGVMQPLVIPIQFSGNTQEIENQMAYEESAWIKVQRMPPAHLTGVGQAETAAQEQIGVSAGESELQNIVKRLEERTADLVAGVLGLVRGFYDDEDFQPMLGDATTQKIKAWKLSSRVGDRPIVRFGLRSARENAVDRKQLMEAIQMVATKIDPATTLPLFDDLPLWEELFREMGLGKPQANKGTLAQLQQLAMIGAQVLKAQQAQQGQKPGAPAQQNAEGPRPSEGDGPNRSNMESGARRGTVNNREPVGVG